jgi:type VI protein secretion system component Hcp
MSIWIEFSSPISKYCEALSVSSGMSSRPAAGGAQRKAQTGDFSLTKNNDAMSVKLMQACVNGTEFDVITIEFYQKNDALYLSYRLKNSLITSYSTSGGGGAQRTDNFSLNAGSVSWEYFKSPGDP